MTTNITLKQLRYFEAVAASGHFGRAAQICAISQPALSVQVRALEEALGAPLLERAPRQVSLTAFGRDFRTRAQDILRRVDDLGALAAQAGTGGALRLGVIPTIAPYLLPRLIPALRRAGHEVTVRETLTPHLLEDLQAGRIDAAVLALPVEAPWTEALPLFSEALLSVRPRGEDGPLDVPRARWLLLEEGHCFRDQALAVCGSGGVSALDGSSLSTLVQMVGAGLGVTLIPEMAAEVEARAAPVDIAPLNGVTATRTVGLIWRRSSPLADRYRGVGDIVRSAARHAVDAQAGLG